MFYDELNDRKRKRDMPPNNAEFMKMLLNLISENATTNNYTITEGELTRHLQVILRDELEGEIHIIPNNTLTIYFNNGEQFNIKIEKSGAYNFRL